MLYENYASKIQKLAFVKNFIIRFRVIIITVISVITALTVTYTSTKGTLPNGISIAPSFIYGEELEYSAEAFLSEVVGYEFMNKDDGVWVKEEPKHVGEYYIRAITEKVSGYRYSNPTPFVINPKTINLTIEDSTITYGSYPSYEVTGLEFGDELSGLGFKFDSLTADKTLVNPVLDSVLIRSTDGLDVTANYQITPDDAEITFLKRSISVEPSYDGKVYDGKNIDYANTYTITSNYKLGYEDKLEITTVIKNEAGVEVNEAIEPGNYTIAVETILVNGSDNLGNYNVTREEHPFTITKRQLLVETKSLSKTYDATALTGYNDGDYFVSVNSVNQLLEGHKLALIDENLPSIVDCNTIINAYEVIVVDENGNNLDKYYDIVDYEYGTLTITQKDVTITTLSDEFTFNGTPHSREMYEISGLIDSHYETVSGFATIMNFGSIDNSCEVVISDGTNDVTANYNIIEDYGTLKVNPATITVKPIIGNDVYSSRKSYDLSSASFEIISGQTYNSDELSIFVNYMINEETHEVVSDSGIYTINGYDYEIINGIKDNYEVIFISGEFEISKIDVEISLDNKIHKFNDAEYKYPTDGFSVLSGEFDFDSEISVSVKFTGKEVSPIDVGEYTISYVTMNPEVLRNHNVTCLETKTLTIVEKDVVLKPYINIEDIVVYNGLSYQYNSNDFTIIDNDNEIYNNEVPWDGEISNVVVKYYQNNQEVNPEDVVNAGVYELEIVSFKYEGKANYAFNTSIRTTLEIKQREVVIAPYITETSKVYDGKYYSYDTTMFRVIKDNNIDMVDTYELFTKDKLDLYVTSNNTNERPINVGTYRIYGTNYSCDPITENNYDIIISDTEYVTYTITPYELIISPVAQESYTYAGIERPYDYNYVVTDKVGNNYGLELPFVNEYFGVKDSIDSIKVLYNGTEDIPVNAGTYNVTISEWYSNEITKNNYKVEFEGSAAIVIDKRKVAVAPLLDNTSAVYGEEFSYNPYLYIIVDMEDNNYPVYYSHFPWDNSTINNVTVNYSFNGEVLDGKPVNRGTYLVNVADYNYVGYDNYEFVRECPYEYEFNITEREVVIAPYITVYEKPYDGLEYHYDTTKYVVLTDNGNTVDGMYGLLPGNSLELLVTYNGLDDYPLNAGTYTIKGKDYKCDKFTENNYRIIISDEAFVTYTITPISISVKPITQPDNIYYNGDYQQYIANEFEIISGKFVGNDSITVQTIVYDHLVNAGTYTIYITGFDFTSGTLEANYVIDYSTTEEFTIKKKELTFIFNGQDPLTYNGLGQAYTSDYTLVDNDGNEYLNTLPYRNVLTGFYDQIYTLYFTYNGKTELPVNAGTYVVVAVGWDSTEVTMNNYDISFAEAKTEMEISKRIVHIAPYISENTFTYDGIEHTYNNSEFRVVKDNGELMNFTYSLLTGDQLTLTVRYECEEYGDTSNPVNAGTYRVYFTGEYSASDITKQNYDIRLDTETYETLTINKREITVIPYLGDKIGDFYNGKTQEYDAKAYEIVNGDISGSHALIEGNEIELAVRYESKMYGKDIPLNADTYHIYIDSIVYKGLANRNYNILYSKDYYVEYIISPIIVAITPILSETKVTYTGDIANCEVVDYKVLPLFADFVEGETIKFTLNPPTEAVDVGSYEVSIDENSFVYENAIESNYIIKCFPAPFEIIPLEVEVSPVAMESIDYDGQVHEYHGKYVVTVNGETYYDELPCYNVLRKSQDVITGFDVLFNGISEPKNAGTYNITFTKWYSDSFTLKNYKVNFVDNEESPITFTINKLEILIAPYMESIDNNKIYTGNAIYSYDSNKYTVIVKKTGERHDIGSTILNSSLKTLPWGGYIDNVEVKYSQTPINAGAYDVSVVSYQYHGDDNYIISASEETVEFNILKRNILVTLVQQESVEYNGLQYTYPGDYYVYDLDDNNTRYDSQLPCCKVNGIDCSSFSYEYKIFDEQKNPIVEIRNAGIYYFQLSGYNPQVEDNYNVTCSEEFVRFEITKKKAQISISMTKEAFYYNGNVVDWAMNYEFGYSGFIDGESVEGIGVTDTDAINVGEYTVKPQITKWINALESNYDIEKYITDDFVINPARIIFVLEDYKSPYTGKPQGYLGEYSVYNVDTQTYITEPNTLPYINYSYAEPKQDTFTNLVFAYDGVKNNLPTLAGKYTVKCVEFTSDTQTMANYEIVSIEGISDTATFEITQRSISIAPFIDQNDNNKVYTGLAYTYNASKFTVIDNDTGERYNVDLNTIKGGELPWGGKITNVTAGYYLYQTDKDGNYVLDEEGNRKLVKVDAINAMSYFVRIESWTFEGTENYYITSSEEEHLFTITRRVIEISLVHQDSKVYNGKDQSYPTNLFNIYDEYTNLYYSKLPCCFAGGGEDCEILDFIKAESFDSKYQPVKEVKNAGKYYFRIVGYNHEIDDNYDVTIKAEEYVPFEITKKAAQVSITMTKSEFSYNGNVVDWLNNYTFGYAGFVEGESVEGSGKVNAKAINAGTYTVEPIINKWINALESNYDIEKYITDDFVINPAEIVFVLDDYEVYYNGKEQAYSYIGRYKVYDVATQKYFTDMLLPYINHTYEVPKQDSFFMLYFTYNGEENKPINAGKYEVKCSSFLSENAQTIANYKIVSVEGIDDAATFEILKRKVEITPILSETSKIYDGTQFIYKDIRYTLKDVTPGATIVNYTNSLPYNGVIDKFYVLYKKLTDKENNIYTPIDKVINAGSYLVTFSDWESTEKGNYDVTFKDVNYEIGKRNVSIMPYIENLSNENVVRDYNSEAYVYNSANYTIIDRDGKKYDNELPFAHDKGIIINDLVVEYYIKNVSGEFVKVNDATDAGTYYVKVVSWKPEILENYIVTASNEKLEFVIDKYDITISYDSGLESNILGRYDVVDGVAVEHVLPNINQFKYLNDNRFFGTDGIKVTATCAKKLVDAGTYRISLDYELITENSGNYNIIVKPVEVEIEKAEVLLKPLDQTHTYDSLSYQYPSGSYLITSINGRVCEDNKLLLGESVSVKVTYDREPITIGTYTIYGQSVLGSTNYDYIFIDSATLTIKEMTVTVAPEFGDKLYGQDYAYDSTQFTTTIGSIGTNDKVTMAVYYVQYNEDTTVNKVFLGSSNIDDLPIELQQYAVSGYPINVGDYYSYISRMEITSKSNDEDRRSNYIVSTTNNIFEVGSNEITISIKNQVETYNGYGIPYNSEYNIEGKLITGDFADIRVYYIGEDGQVYLGNSDINDLDIALQENAIKGYPINAGTYKIYISNISIISQRMNNYIVHWSNNENITLTIDKRTVTFRPKVENEKELIYNFEELTPELDITYNSGSLELVLNHQVVPTGYRYFDSKGIPITAQDIINAGTYYVEIAGHNLVNFKEGEDTNYKFNFERTRFKVSALDVTIELADQEKPYDGLAFDEFVIKGVTSNPLVADKVSALQFKVRQVMGSGNLFKNVTEIVNVDTYDITSIVSWEVTGDIADNFNIIIQKGTKYTITPLTIDLTLGSQEFTYNGDKKTYDNYLFNGVLSGYTIDPIFIFTKDGIEYSENELVHFGVYNITLAGYNLFDSEGKEIIDYDSNYEVNITKDSNPIVTIKQLEITLTTNDQKLAYTTQFIGYDPQYLGFRDIDGKVIPDYKLFTFDVYYLDFNDSTKVVTNPTNVGKYYILIDKSSVKVNNEYNDYIINVESDLKNVGILEITKANIEISFIKTIGTYGTPKGIDYRYDVLTLIEGKVVKLEGFTIENLIIKYYKDGQLIVDEKGLPMLPKNVGTYTAEFVDYTLKYNGTIIEDKSNFAVSFLKDSDPTIIIDPLFVSIDGRHYNEYHEYNGQAITRADNEYCLVDLPYGDKITITPQIYVDGKLYTSDMVHAGMYEIRLLEENLSFISGSKENYKFVYNSGYYQIIPKNVYVEIIASDNGKVYDGEKVEVTWNYITGSAPIGDDILDLSSVLKYNLTRQKDSYLGNGYVNEVKDAGTYRISFGNDFVVTSSIGSYTSDYSIRYTNLTYVIKQREIKITTPSKTVYYSGVEVHAFEKENLKLQEGYELVTGHELGIALTGNAITSISKYEVGTKENILDIWVFDGKDNVTDNYNISESEWGTITVLKRPIIVTSGTSSRVYEGSATSKNFTYREFTMRDVEGIELPPLDYSMLTTQIIPTSKSKVRFVTDGIVENRFNFSAVYDGEDISPCFDVIKECGTIHITERPITIGFNPEFTNWNWYSGAEFDVSKLLIAVDGTTLGASDKINANASLRYFKTHDKYGNPIEPVEVASMINAGTYRVVIGDIVITKNNSSDVLTENYDISIDTSITEFMVTIKPLTISVRTNTEAKIWDGKPLYNTGIHANRSEYSQEGYGMLSNHDVRAKTDSNYTIVPAYDKNGEKVIGTFDNNLEYEVYDTLTGEIVTDNYIIDEDPGELIVVDYFIIDYWTNSEYTGQNHTISTVTGTCEDFHNNQIHNLRFEIEVSCNEMVEIGSYELIPNYDTLILYVNGEDWTNVYKDYLVIEKSSFMYNISPISIHMKPKDLEDAIYNGERQGCTPDQFEDGINYEILSGHLLPGHYAEIETKYSFITQSSTPNNYITGVTIRDEQGNDVTNLYSITYNAEWSKDIKVRQRYYAKLKVLRFEIKYTTGSAEKTYDGTPLTCEQYEIDPNIVASLNELLAKLGHRIDVYRIPSLTLPTTQTGNNNLGIRIVDSNGKPVNNAYSFKCQAGTLKVNPLVITIETPDVEFEYDGDEHSSSVNDCKYISGLLEGHTLEIKKMTTYWQPVITQNKVVSFKVYDANGTDVSSGYVIEYSKCGQFIIM